MPADSNPARTPPQDYAALAGKRDDIMREKTGRDWAEWVRTLDAADAHALTHTEIARIVHDVYNVPEWWAQTVTVGYERIRGLRAQGQRRDGSWEAGRSRTLPVPAGTAFDACNDAALRARWLTGARPVVTAATRARSIRMRWPDGTSVVLGFTPKGEDRCAVDVQHMKLPDQAARDRMKQYWGERLDALGALLRTD